MDKFRLRVAFMVILSGLSPLLSSEEPEKSNAFLYGLWTAESENSASSGEYWEQRYLFTRDFYWAFLQTGDKVSLRFGRWELKGDGIHLYHDFTPPWERVLDFTPGDDTDHVFFNDGDSMVPFQRRSVFLPDYQATVNLRLRSEPAVSGRLITTIPAKTPVTALESGPEEEIDGLLRPWMRVVLENGTTGWCFGGYLSSLTITEEDIYRFIRK